jgi:hypothetical protein
MNNRQREDGMHGSIRQQRFCGREFNIEDVSLIQEVVDTCGGISRNELANTVCELLEWKRPNGRLKNRECLELLERLGDKGVLELPDKRQEGNSAPRKRMAAVKPDAPYSALTGSVEDFGPLEWGCYRAANWIELGETTGRGRMDKTNQRQGDRVKTILVYPLVKNAARRLRDGR